MSSDLTPEIVEPLLAGRLGRPYRFVVECASTQRLLGEDEPEGTTVATDHQTEGRGRLGRIWEDAPGRGLLFSVLLQPDAATWRFGPSSRSSPAKPSLRRCPVDRATSATRTTSRSGAARSPGSSPRRARAGSARDRDQRQPDGDRELPAETVEADDVAAHRDGPRVGARAAPRRDPPRARAPLRRLAAALGPGTRPARAVRRRLRRVACAPGTCAPRRSPRRGSGPCPSPA